MRSAALAAVAAVLILVGTAILPPPAQLQPGEAAAAECTWKPQVKRVVKRVRRDGKVRRVVRRRVRWVCVPRVTMPAVLPPAPVPPAPPPSLPPVPEPEPEANRLAVKAAEYFYVLSRPSVRAGEVTIELNNRGEDPHNLNLREEDDEGVPYELPETDSLQRNVASFELPAGNYRLWCSLPEHEEKGMHTTLVVE